jgi:hypothetical protein
MRERREEETMSGARTISFVNDDVGCEEVVACALWGGHGERDARRILVSMAALCWRLK